jgi:cytochrome c-type biogenesis protein CcmH/NrfG
LEEALKLDARDADTHVMMGDIYLQMEKKHEACEAYEKAVSLGVPRMELMEKLKKCK